MFTVPALEVLHLRPDWNISTTTGWNFKAVQQNFQGSFFFFFFFFWWHHSESAVTKMFSLDVPLLPNCPCDAGEFHLAHFPHQRNCTVSHKTWPLLTENTSATLKTYFQLLFMQMQWFTSVEITHQGTICFQSSHVRCSRSFSSPHRINKQRSSCFKEITLPN